MYAHHKYQNGLNDPTSTIVDMSARMAGCVVLDSLMPTYASVIRSRGCSAAGAKGYWQSMRSQHLFDTLAAITIVLAYLIVRRCTAHAGFSLGIALDPREHKYRVLSPGSRTHRLPVMLERIIQHHQQLR